MGNSVTIKITGGLGNQMFQYAFIKALSLRNKVNFKLDIFEYKTYFRPYELEIFNIKKIYAKENEIPFYERIRLNNRYYSYFNNVFLKPFFSNLNKNHFKEKVGFFETKFLSKNKGYFEGYFQSENYFKDYESDIKEDFTFSKKLSKKNLELLSYLDGKNTVSVHVRRGDYLNNQNIHSICSLGYYNKAIGYIYDKINNPVFLFFSDDPGRVKKHLNYNNSIYIVWNKQKDSRQDMFLMSNCKHNIIANSSFSWRGAWLNQNENIVIAPTYRTTKNLYSNPNIIPMNRKKI